MTDLQNKVVSRITLYADASVSNRPACIYAKQYDTKSRYIVATIKSFTGQIDLSGVARLNAKRPDGTFCYATGTINPDNTVTVELPAQLLSVAGELSCDISIFADEDASQTRLTTSTFRIRVEESNYEAYAIEGSDEHWIWVKDTLLATREGLRDAVVVNGEVRYPSEGLEYAKTNGSQYEVVGIGTCTDINVVVPRIYNGLPVTAIGESAFENASIDSITLYESITRIGDNAFAGSTIRWVYLYSTVPPYVQSTAFSDSVKVFVVPLHSVDIYKKNSYWVGYADKITDRANALWDLLMSWDTMFIFDGGDADVTLAVLDDTVLE